MTTTMAPTNGKVIEDIPVAEETALARTNNALPSRTHLGDRRQVAAIHARMRVMMNIPADAPDDVVWAAAQIAVAYRLDPFAGEVMIIDLGWDTKLGVQTYRPYIGIKGLRTLARRIANYTGQPEEMEPEKVAQYRRGMYDSQDVGVRYTLYRLDVAREARDAGVPYYPSLGMGFWRQKARKKQGEWKPDNVPNTWTEYQVAEKRAEIDAIKKAFDLRVDVADPAYTNDDDVIDVMSDRIRQDDMDHALPAPHHDYQVEEDGDILFEAETPRNGQKQAVVTPEPIFEEDMFTESETPQDVPAVPAMPDSAPDPMTVAVGELTGQTLGTILAWAVQHSELSKDEAKTLWNAVRHSKAGVEALRAFVQTILIHAA